MLAAVMAMVLASEAGARVRTVLELALERGLQGAGAAAEPVKGPAVEEPVGVVSELQPGHGPGEAGAAAEMGPAPAICARMVELRPGPRAGLTEAVQDTALGLAMEGRAGELRASVLGLAAEVVSAAEVMLGLGVDGVVVVLERAPGLRGRWQRLLGMVLCPVADTGGVVHV